MKISSLIVLSTVFSLVSVCAFAAPTPTPSSSPANGLSIQITSFMPTSADNRTGEVCGQVTVGSNELPKLAGNFIAVTVTSDPKYNPASYTTLADPTGVFCALVFTETGTVEASAWLPTAQLKSVSGVSKLGLKRQ